MEQLLSYDKDDFEDTFDLNFTISVESFGETIVHPLKLNGANIAVTKENRGEFVDRYVDFVLNKAAEGQFSAFYEGFHRVCGGRILELFQPQELKAMVEGNENYDWNLLQEVIIGLVLVKHNGVFRPSNLEIFKTFEYLHLQNFH